MLLSQEKKCNCCQKVWTCVDDDKLEPMISMELLIWECACGSTLAVNFRDTQPEITNEENERFCLDFL
jgi:hypothetical protein